MTRKSKSSILPYAPAALFAALFIAELIYLLIYSLVAQVTVGLILILAVVTIIRWSITFWLARKSLAKEGKFVIFVYSNSPVWHDYIDQNILPRISAYTHILNWSEKLTWSRVSPVVRTYMIRTGSHWYTSSRGKRSWWGREHTPAAIVFTGWGWPELIRFHQPFKDYKHGNITGLKKAEDRLFLLVDSVTQKSS